MLPPTGVNSTEEGFTGKSALIAVVIDPSDDSTGVDLVVCDLL